MPSGRRARMDEPPPSADGSREAVADGGEERRRRRGAGRATDRWRDDADTEEEEESLLSTARTEDGEEVTVEAPSGRGKRLVRRRERQAATAARTSWEDLLDVDRLYTVYEFVLSKVSVLRRLQQMRVVCSSWDSLIMNWPGPPTARYVVTYQRKFLILYVPEEARWARMTMPFALPPEDETYGLVLSAALLDSSHGMLCLALQARRPNIPAYVLRVWNVATQTWTDVPPVPADENPAFHHAHPDFFVYPYCKDTRLTLGRRMLAPVFVPIYVRLRPAPSTTNPTDFLLSVAAIVRPPGLVTGAVGFPVDIQGCPFVVSTYCSRNNSWSTTRTQFPVYPGCSTWLPTEQGTSGSMLHCLNDGARHDSEEAFFITKRRTHPDGNPENAITIYNERTGTFRELYEHGTVEQPPKIMMTSYGFFVRCRDDVYLVVSNEAGLYVYKLYTTDRAWVLYDGLPPGQDGFISHGWRCVAIEDCIYIASPLSRHLALIAYNVETKTWTLTPRRSTRASWRCTDQPDILSFHLSSNPCRL